MLVRTKVAIGVALALLIVASGATIVALEVSHRTITVQERLNARNVSAVIRSEIRRADPKFETHAKVVTRARELKKALSGLEGDERSRIVSEEISPTFHRLTAAGDIQIMAVYDATGAPVAVFPKDSGVTPGKELVAQTIEAVEARSGVIAITSQRIGYARAFPILKRRKLVGVGVYAIDLSAQLKTVSEAIGAEAVLYIDGSVVGTTEGAPSDEPLMSMLEDRDGATAVISIGEKHWQASRVDISAEQGEMVASAIVLVDVTEAYADVIVFSRVAKATLVLGVLGFIGIFSFWLRQQLRPLNEVICSLEALASGETIENVEGVHRKDEIGAIARAMSAFGEAQLERAHLEEQNREAAAEVATRAEEAARMGRAIAKVVEAARRGTFDQRMDADFEESANRDIAFGINAMLDVVDAGVSETERVISNLAKGDLGDRMNGEYEGAFAALSDGVNATMERLSVLMTDIVEASLTIHRDVADIAAGSEQLSASAEQQAGSLEETAATMEEMTATVNANAESASHARDLAANATTRATAGGEVVSVTVDAMSSIERSAAKISDIVSVIDGIAFQTNLLALNAAVEAARAGDAGKGFAVVASEVRTLSQRSADAARDIKVLIEVSNRQVSEGVSLVDQTGAALEEILGAVGEVERSINSIASAGVEQAAGVSELSNTISYLDGLTQQNSQRSSESAANARSLSVQAERLQKLVAFFRTDAVVDQGAPEAA